MDIKEIALTVGLQVFEEHPYDEGHIVSPSGYTWIDDKLIEFAEALIESYKADLLKEVGEPIYVEGTCEIQNWKWIRLAVDQANEYDRWGWKIRKLFTSDQVAAAILKAEQQAKELSDSVAQKVAEACALQVATEIKFHWLDAARVAKEIRSGEWRKFVKEV